MFDITLTVIMIPFSWANFLETGSDTGSAPWTSWAAPATDRCNP